MHTYIYLRFAGGHGVPAGGYVRQMVCGSVPPQHLLQHYALAGGSRQRLGAAGLSLSHTLYLSLSLSLTLSLLYIVHTSAYVSIRQHTAASVSILQQVVDKEEERCVEFLDADVC
jgi:hypothetical protein